MANKNNPANKKTQSKAVLALSSECEVRNEKCQSGTLYLETMKNKGFGRGVVCKKNK